MPKSKKRKLKNKISNQSRPNAARSNHPNPRLQFIEKLAQQYANEHGFKKPARLGDMPQEFFEEMNVRLFGELGAMFNDPFASGLIKESAVDEIAANPQLVEILNRLPMPLTLADYQKESM